MRKLLDPETNTGGTEAPQPQSPPQQPLTQDEQYGQIVDAFTRIASQNQGGLMKRMLIDPRAAAALPQNPAFSEVAKVGIHPIWGSGGVQFPFAAWAQQHQPTVSPNTKNMAKTLAELEKIPQGDPRVQRGIDNGLQNDIFGSSGLLEEGAGKYGSINNALKVIDGEDLSTSDKLAYYNKVHSRMNLFVNMANLSKNIMDNVKWMNEEKVKGNRINPEAVSTLSDYYAMMSNPSIPNEEKQKLEEKYRDKLNVFSSVETYAKQFAPNDFKWGEVSYITGAKEILDNGKTRDIPRTFSDWKVINPDGTDGTAQFKSVVDNIVNQATMNGDDLGIKGAFDNPDAIEKRKQFIAQYLADKSPKQTTETISRERSTNINIKQVKETPLTEGADKFNDWNSTKFASSNSTVKDASYPAAIQRHFEPPKVSKDGTGAVVFDSKIPAEELSKVESNPAWGLGVLSHALDANGNSFSNTDEYQIMTSNQTQVQPEKIDGKVNPNAGKPFPKPEINLDGISMVYGTDPDGDKGFQPTTILKNIDKTGKELNQEGYVPYYRMAYTVNYYDKEGKPTKKTLYHYVDSRNDGATRALDDFFLSTATAEDIEKLTQ